MDAAVSANNTVACLRSPVSGLAAASGGEAAGIGGLPASPTVPVTAAPQRLQKRLPAGFRWLQLGQATLPAPVPSTRLPYHACPAVSLTHR